MAQDKTLQNTYQALPTITVLKQTHYNAVLYQSVESIEREDQLTSSMRSSFNSVAESQFNIARYLAKNKDAVVIIENGPVDVFQGKYKEKENQAKILFPKNLPKLYSHLTFEQKKFLFKHGGAYYSVYHHDIEKVYADNDLYLGDSKAWLQQAPKLSAKERDRSKAKLDQNREYATLTLAEKIAIKTKNNAVIIIYGGMHDFSELMSCFPNLKLVTYDMSVTEESYRQLYAKFQDDYKFFRPAVSCDELSSSLTAREESRLVTRGESLRTPTLLEYSPLLLVAIPLLALTSLVMRKLNAPIPQPRSRPSKEEKVPRHSHSS